MFRRSLGGIGRELGQYALAKYVLPLSFYLALHQANERTWSQLHERQGRPCQP